MVTQKRRSDFIDSAEGKDVKRKLQRIAVSSSHNTASSYSANSLLYPDNLIPFVDKHMNYLMNHPKLESSKYIANIRLMTRVR